MDRHSSDSDKEVDYPSTEEMLSDFSKNASLKSNDSTYDQAEYAELLANVNGYLVQLQQFKNVSPNR